MQQNEGSLGLAMCLVICSSIKRISMREIALPSYEEALPALRKKVSRTKRSSRAVKFIGDFEKGLNMEIDEELLGDRMEEKAIQQVRQLVQRSERFNTPLTAYMIGIDGMEEIRKLYGSAFAAFLLVQVAYRLKRTLRSSDATSW